MSKSNGTIRVKVVARKSPKDRSIKYYGNVDLYSQIGRDQILEAAQRNSQIPKSYLDQTFDALEVEIENFVMNGHSITLDGLGTITSTLHSRGVESEDLVLADNINRVKFGFRAASNLRKMLKSANIIVNPLPAPKP